VSYHSPPAPPMRDFFWFCTLLGIELGASTTWNTLPVLLLCICFSDRTQGNFARGCPHTKILLSLPLSSWDYRTTPLWPIQRWDLDVSRSHL
jgi:hypothetical protein